MVWLENGGGKTVFLALLFHVLSPRHAPQVGNDHKGRRGDISDFVLAGDVAHVVVEWKTDDSGSERLITGLVAERRGASVNRTWYLLTLRDDRIGVDDLVFDEDGRRVSAAAYLESLEQLSTRSGKAGRRNRVEFVRTNIQRTWLETLANHHLDPALFEYQVRMNKAEGGATTLFQFPSSEKFIEFFIELTMNQDTLDSLSQTLSLVAEKVAELPRRELSLAHANGAVGHLDRVASGWSRYLKADQDLADADQEAAVLKGRLAAAVAAGEAAVDDAGQTVEELTEAARKADKDRKDTESYARHLAIKAADARLAERDAQIEGAQKVVDDAELTVAAWPRLDLVLRLDQLRGEVEELHKARQEADREAAPLIERRDQLGRALREAYELRLSEARTNLERAESDLGDAEGDIETAEALYRQAETAIAGAEGQTKELYRQVDRHEKAVSRAVADGVLDEGAKPAEALAAATDEVAALAARIGDLAEERRAETAELAQLRDESRRAAADANEAETEAQRLRQRAADGSQERAEISAHPLLAELGAGDADLELVGSDLVRRVENEAERRSSEFIEAAVESAEDRRAVDSIERDRLLPPRAEVESVCALLKSEGVESATPGWRYITEALSADEQIELIESKPAVADGIVIAERDLARAREILAEFAPASAIAVATAATLDGEPTINPGMWVVPPDRAMYDPSEAEAARTLRLERIEEADTRQSNISSAERKARTLAAALQAHLDAWPPGTLAAAESRAQAATEAAALAREESAETDRRLAATEERIESIDAQLEELRAAQVVAEQRHSRLRHLTDEAETVAVVQGELEELAALRQKSVDDRNEASELASDARRRQQQAAASIRTAEKAAEAAERSLGELPEFGDGPAAEYGSIENLRSRYAESARLAAAATSDSEVARRLAEREDERQQVEERWRALPADLQNRVHMLIQASAAGDPSARNAAEAEAATAARHARERLSDLQAEHRMLKQHRDGLPAPERTIEGSDLPDDADRLESMSRDAYKQAKAARDRRSEADDALRHANEAQQQAKTRLDKLKTQLDSLISATGDRTAEPATPLDGDPAEEVRRVVEKSRQARQRREEADRDWRQAASAAGTFGRDERWEALKGDLPRRLRNDAPEQLARSASDLLAQTRLLADRLRDEIDKLDTHRQLLVTSLGDAVSEARRSLNQAQTKSTLPQGLGEWSGHPFLKIRLSVPADRAELDSRLRRFTNDLLERENVTKAGLPTGAPLVCQAVLACADKTVNVDVLKPNKAQRARYETITEMATLSGGMRATAAIAMFCTLARVRASNQTGKAGVGTLVLDNPIGDANATYLVNLQRQVARMSDVQLLYTTGVNDMDALRQFPTLARFNNEAAKRSHLAYVVADETFLKSLAPSEGDHTLVTGTRLMRRQDPLFTQPPEQEST